MGNVRIKSSINGDENLHTFKLQTMKAQFEQDKNSLFHYTSIRTQLLLQKVK
jgi:hypothetical protein